MKRRFALLLGSVALAAMAQPAQPPRWVKADDLRVRSGPGTEHPVTGVLQRGAQVVLKSPDPQDGFCLVEGEGLYGYTACQFLSTEPVSRPRAGQDGVPADRRWVNGSAVTLRAGATREAQALARLALNRSVQLLRADAGGGYCEVQPLDRAGNAEGPRGFTACQYLAPEPLSTAKVAGVDPDTEKAFWRAPGWQALDHHATALAARLPDREAGPWPRDEALERMKAHLALGLKAPPPEPLGDWAALKQLAAAHDASVLDAAPEKVAADRGLFERRSRASTAASRLDRQLHIPGELHYAVRDGGAARLLRLVQALEVPAVAPSLFRSEVEIAPPGDDAPALAGRFGGVYRTVVTARPPASPAGLYDMHTRTQSLARPVRWVRLFRDGRLEHEPSRGYREEVLWRDTDPPTCEDFVAGFGFGDVEGPVWKSVSDVQGDAQGARKAQQLSRTLRPAGSLFAYQAPLPPPRARAGVTVQTVRLDRAATGFARFQQLAFDLDADGVPDLLVLEGTGQGAGHLEPSAGQDDTWYRLLLVNVSGAWKVLGADSFQYGCGC